MHQSHSWRQQQTCSLMLNTGKAAQHMLLVPAHASGAKRMSKHSWTHSLTLHTHYNWHHSQTLVFLLSLLLLFAAAARTPPPTGYRHIHTSAHRSWHA